MTATVGSELLNEIERVSAKRERWREYSRTLSMAPSFAPGIAMMTLNINQAKQAIQSGDAADFIRVLEALRSYDEND